MLHKLTLKGFAVHRHREIDFTNGLTSIVGANGVGKSLIVEAIRYALFGTAALRGDHPEKVVLEFSVRGVRYRVTRSQRDAKVEEVDGPTLAVGTKPTNQRVVELFGYGLDVFDVANCANQGLIEALSNMKPAERKRMIETTIGVDALEKLLEFTRKEASGATKEADALARGLGVAPECPEAPSDARSEAELAAEAAYLEQEANVLSQAQRNLTLPAPAPPDRDPPPLMELPVPVSVLEEASKQWDKTRVLIDHQGAKLSNKKLVLTHAGGSPVYNEEFLDAATRYFDALRVVDAHPKPEHDLAYCDAQEKLHDDAGEYARWAKLHAAGEHECPACRHTWPVRADEMSKLRDWHGVTPARPEASRAQLARMRADIRAFDQVREDVEKASATAMAVLIEYPTVGKLTSSQLDNQKLRSRLENEVAEMTLELIRMQKDSSQQQILAELFDRYRINCNAHEEWTQRNRVYHEHRKLTVAWQETVERLRDIPTQLAATRTALMERQVYDRLHAAWETAMAGRAEREAEIASLRLRAEQWKEASAAIGEVRQQIESHLVPGLAALSSMLVSRMTGGRRQTVTIDPGFALSLDNQDVNTLSGSEKAAVNLALRIALGRMLTSRVFSVLILDEPDAAMDDERAASTADCLRSLCPEIAQVILVTHKQIETDAQVVLN